MLDDDDESSDGEPEAPAISPRTAARREKARLAADREEAEYVATKALADAEARRLDREQNAEKYAAEDAARRVSEAEAKIGEADVLVACEKFTKRPATPTGASRSRTCSPRSRS